MLRAVDELAGAYGWTKDYTYYNVTPREYLGLTKKLRRRQMSEHLLFLHGIVHPYRNKQAAAEYIKLIEREAGITEAKQAAPLEKDKLQRLKERLSGK